jgi:hypothetical protein
MMIAEVCDWYLKKKEPVRKEMQPGQLGWVSRPPIIQNVANHDLVSAAFSVRKPQANLHVHRVLFDD